MEREEIEPRAIPEPEQPPALRLGRLGSANRRLVPIKVHGLELQALFDTGSDGSVISTRVWEMFPEEERPELRPGDRPIEGPSGYIVEQEGVTNLLLNIDGRLIQRLIRVADIVEDVILGNDILEPFRLNWDYERRRILWPKDTVPLGDSGLPDSSQPERCESVVGGESVHGEEFTECEREPDEPQDMEVPSHVPGGMDDMLPQEHGYLGGLEDSEEIPGDLDETPLLVGATQLRDSGVDDMPPQIPEYLAQPCTDSWGHRSPEQQSLLDVLLGGYQYGLT